MKTHLALALAALGASTTLAPAEGAVPAFRPPAVPLVTVDPHFSLWSAADHLYDRETTFWAGQNQPFSLTLTADGVTYRLCGRSAKTQDLPVLEQTACEVGATTTRYRFAGRTGLAAEVTFVTPRLTDNLDVYSRPVTYVTIRVTGAKAFDVKAEMADALATNDDRAPMVRTPYEVAGVPAVKVGRRDQKPFATRGDRKRPDWGFAHLVGPVRAGGEVAYLLAYDDLVGVRFFGRDLVSWWRRGGKSFETMLAEALRERTALVAKCAAFDADFRRDMTALGGADYADVTSLAWRQSFGACKCVAGPNDELFLFSNENGSGGMIGTTDVFYPQLPHLLMTSLTLAKGSLAPTCIYASSTNWPYAYAPHDMGIFPVAEGQYYGMKKGQAVGGGADDTFRMPVEESGNMLLCLGAVSVAEGNADFAGRWWKAVSDWAHYLERFGFDPGNQLCTDDFAGHLAHNANLSIKAIVALGAYGKMAGMRGERSTEEKYVALARGLAAKWLESAKGGRHGGYRLAFDQPDTWSLKYNLVWDRLLALDLFPPSVATAEMRVYRAEARTYGLPLDSRRTYGKADWALWIGALTGSRDDLAFMAGGVRRFLNESPDRIAFGDWYFADAGLARSFVARSVVGGVFLPVLHHPELVSRYRAGD